jgi:hypothetical protein
MVNIKVRIFALRFANKEPTLFQAHFSRDAVENKIKKNFRKYLVVGNKALIFAPAFETKQLQKKRSLTDLHKQYK